MLNLMIKILANPAFPIMRNPLKIMRKLLVKQKIISPKTDFN